MQVCCLVCCLFVFGHTDSSFLSFFSNLVASLDIGVKEFELNYSRSARAGEMKLAGFPISKLEDWAAKVLAKGYKVAIVDEQENSVAKAMREKKTGTKDKIIERSLSTVLTAGTLVYSTVLTDDMSNYCMSIKEVVAAHGKTTFGVVILDASTAEINLSLLEDDNDRTQLETLITQMKPKEIVYEKGCLASQTLRMFKNNLSSPLMNGELLFFFFPFLYYYYYYYYYYFAPTSNFLALRFASGERVLDLPEDLGGGGGNELPGRRRGRQALETEGRRPRGAQVPC